MTLLAFSLRSADRLRCAHHHAKYQHNRDGPGGTKGEFVPANEFLEAVEPARGTRYNWLALQVTLNVRRQSVRRLVTARAVFLQRFHHDPIQVAAQQVNQFWRVGVAMLG